MSALQTFVTAAQQRATHFTKCSPQQALTYACEDTVEAELGSREFASKNLEQWVDAVCQREDLDTPQIVVARASSLSLGHAYVEHNAMCIRGTSTTAATVLHELAHLSVGIEGHGVLFRDEYVRLCRAHISVDYAAMLHALFTGVGLEMSPWPASAARR